MSTYPARRARWLKLAAHLPPDLQDRIALRNICAASSLPPRALETLSKALDAGLRQAGSIRLLQQHPEAGLDEIVRQLRVRRRPPASPGTAANASSTADLAALIRKIFPSWSQTAVDALAGDPLTAELRALLLAWRACRTAAVAGSETFDRLLAAFVQQAAEELQPFQTGKPQHTGLPTQRSLPWPEPDHRPKP